LLGVTVADQDIFTEEEIRTEPMYNYLRGIGAGWAIGFTTQVPTGDTLVANFEGAHARGAFQAQEVAFIESLRPHFSRSALLTARLGMERARAAAETMGVIGLPAGVVAHNNRLIAANALLSDMIPSVILDGRDRVRLANPKADAMMCDACARLSKDKGVGTALSIPIPGSEERKALVVHIVPVRRAAHDIFSGALCLLVVTPLARKDAPPASLIQGLFDLTSAEAKVARGLAAGETAQEIALRLGNSLGTIRTHIKSIFLKTGITKQADLVALLAGVSL
jgi:DNA-binding CsgD family transcriptional regulator